MGQKTSVPLTITNLAHVKILAVTQWTGHNDSSVLPQHFTVDNAAGVLTMELNGYDTFFLKINYLTESGLVKTVEIVVTKENRDLLKSSKLSLKVS